MGPLGSICGHVFCFMFFTSEAFAGHSLLESAMQPVALASCIRRNVQTPRCHRLKLIALQVKMSQCLQSVTETDWTGQVVSCHKCSVWQTTPGCATFCAARLTGPGPDCPSDRAVVAGARRALLARKGSGHLTGDARKSPLIPLALSSTLQHWAQEDARNQQQRMPFNIYRSTGRLHPFGRKVKLERQRQTSNTGSFQSPSAVSPVPKRRPRSAGKQKKDLRWFSQLKDSLDMACNQLRGPTTCEDHRVCSLGIQACHARCSHSHPGACSLLVSQGCADAPAPLAAWGCPAATARCLELVRQDGSMAPPDCLSFLLLVSTAGD